MDRLMRYFSEDAADFVLGESVGMEVETSFVDRMERPIPAKKSQFLLQHFAIQYGWRVWQKKGDLITEIRGKFGDKILYELGRQNIELATAPLSVSKIVWYTKMLLEQLYQVGKKIDIYPYFHPILETDEDLLVIPDERDAVWLTLDGRPALELLARISAVQFTIAIRPREAIAMLNRLGRQIGSFLKDYPQEELWRRYIKESLAGYHPLRYGGPLFFNDLNDYCAKLAEHDVVAGPQLMPHKEAGEFDISLFLRSIWWYFRLKRYGSALCIEVRPLARRTDRMLSQQLALVMDSLA